MLTLLCIPCAGGSAGLYQSWAGALGAAVDMQVLELPGRGRRSRERLHEDFRTLVDALTHDLVRAVAGSNRPYAIFGHSMGALLAQGIARGLPASLSPPCALLLSACAAPSARQWSPPDDSDRALIASLRRQGGTAEEVFACPELMEMVLPVLRADYRVCNSFQRQSALLRMPLHVFGGIDDAVPAAALHAWQQESAAPVTLDWFAGGHFYLQPQRDALLARIAHYLMRYRHGGRKELFPHEALSNA